jgi:hypothetical protein
VGQRDEPTNHNCTQHLPPVSCDDDDDDDDARHVCRSSRACGSKGFWCSSVPPQQPRSAVQQCVRRRATSSSSLQAAAATDLLLSRALYIVPHETTTQPRLRSFSDTTKEMRRGELRPPINSLACNGAGQNISPLCKLPFSHSPPPYSLPPTATAHDPSATCTLCPLVVVSLHPAHDGH